MAAAVVVGLLSLLPHLLPHAAAPAARRGRACLPTAITSAKDGEAAPTDPTTDRLLALIAGTDRGVTASNATRAEINRLIGQLEASFDGVDALAPERASQLLRNAEVVYVGQSSSKQANAAGGKYRGRVGRLLFQTDALFQHVLEGGAAVNVVSFRLLGLLPGMALLQGQWRRASAEDRRRLRRTSARPLSANTVAVEFGPPRVALLGGLLPPLQLGPPSRVGLDVTYLDNRLRICRGAGSAVPFVFRYDTAGGPLSAKADAWRAVAAARALGARSFAAPMILAAVVAPLLPHLRGVSASLRRILLTVSLPFALAAAAVLTSTGGIVTQSRADPDTQA